MSATLPRVFIVGPLSSHLSPLQFSLRNLGTTISCFRTVEAARPAPVEQFMSEQEQTYDEGRARNLEALLRALALRITELDANGQLLEHAGDLMRLIGDVRSELFHYEVRVTYDTPEVADNRRIVREAKQDESGTWQPSEWIPDEEEDPEW